MEEIKLDVQVRKEVGKQKSKAIRRTNFVPGVVYGETKTPTVIKVERSAYEKIMRTYQGQNVLLHLNVMEGDKKLRDYSVIVREEQHDPVLDNLIHVDFQRINLKKEIEINVMIVAKGDAPGVKKDGGSIDQPLHELDVICLPTHIPKEITVDVSKMMIGDAVHVSDLVLPSGVRTKHDPKSIVLSVVPPMKEEVERAEGAATEPELIREKKEKEGEEGAEAPAAGGAKAAAPKAEEKKADKK